MQMTTNSRRMGTLSSSLLQLPQPYKMARPDPWPLTLDFSLLWAPCGLWTPFIIFCLISQFLECLIMRECPVGSSSLFLKSSFETWCSTLYIIIIKLRSPCLLIMTQFSKYLHLHSATSPYGNLVIKAGLLYPFYKQGNLCPGSSLLR